MESIYSYYMAREGSVQLTENFKVKEFKSRDCPIVLIHPELTDRLQILRDALGAPININSGYRSFEHNKSVSGSANSAHLIGAAADIWTPKCGTIALARLIQRTFGKDVAIGAHPDYAYVHIDIIYRGNWYLEELRNKVSTF